MYSAVEERDSLSTTLIKAIQGAEDSGAGSLNDGYRDWDYVDRPRAEAEVVDFLKRDCAQPFDYAYVPARKEKPESWDPNLEESLRRHASISCPIS